MFTLTKIVPSATMSFRPGQPGNAGVRAWLLCLLLVAGPWLGQARNFRPSQVPNHGKIIWMANRLRL